jgi:hypothetical protein
MSWKELLIIIVVGIILGVVLDRLYLNWKHDIVVVNDTTYIPYTILLPPVVLDSLILPPLVIYADIVTEEDEQGEYIYEKIKPITIQDTVYTEEGDTIQFKFYSETIADELTVRNKYIGKERMWDDFKEWKESQPISPVQLLDIAIYKAPVEADTILIRETKEIRVRTTVSDYLKVVPAAILIYELIKTWLSNK